MNNLNSYWPVLIALLIGGVIGWLLKPTEDAGYGRVPSLRVDTVVRVIEHAPVSISAPARVRIVRDTVIVNGMAVERDTAYTTPPFVATLDTIVGRDTVSSMYQYPQNTMSVVLRRAADSIRVEYRTITLTTEPKEHRSFLEYLGVFAVGGALGFVVGGR